MTEQHIRLAARMYEMRDFARRISGEKYDERIEGWKRFLATVAARFDTTPMQAIPMMAKSHRLGDMETMWLTAAAVELAETVGTVQPQDTAATETDRAADRGFHSEEKEPR